jgi:hypothetical protein
MRLWAQDEEDAAIVSALLQDACVKPAEVHYDAKARRVVILAHRFCWECETPQRVHAALRIENVTKARRRGWPDAPAPALELLGLVFDSSGITLAFAGGTEIELEVEVLDLILEDLDQPAAAPSVPHHEA